MVRSGSVACLLMLLGAVPKASVAQAPTDYQVKAAFLYNFSRFVQWPTAPRGDESPFVVTILGSDPFGTTLDETLRGKTVGDRPIAVRRVSRVAEVGASQVLFIAASESGRLPAILKQVGTAAVLTVGDMDRFAEKGGVIGFKLDEQRVRLTVNLEAAERAHLRISSQLLRLAQIVGASEGG